MQDCFRFAPMIAAREGELTPGEAKTLQAHLETCARCRADAADAAATEGLVSEALLARANERDFSTFVDGVMEKVGEGAPGRRSGVLAWLAGHRRAAAATLAPVLAALAVIVYVRWDGGTRDQIALLELSAEGNVTMVLQTTDGPVVLLADEEGS